MWGDSNGINPSGFGSGEKNLPENSFIATTTLCGFKF